MHELIAEVRRLRVENARLRGVLRIYADHANWSKHETPGAEWESTALSKYRDLFGDEDGDGWAPAEAALKEGT